MNSLPFGKCSHRVTRVASRVVTERDDISREPSTSTPASGSRPPESEFPWGGRPEPFTVRRTEMAVGEAGRRLDLSYMDSLMDAPLASLPTPAQLCRKHTTRSGVQQKLERKRTVSRRDDGPDIHNHLTQLYSKQRLCGLENSAQEVPTSPHRDLPPKESSSLTFHGRTPLKASSMLFQEPLPLSDSATPLHLAFDEDREGGEGREGVGHGESRGRDDTVQEWGFGVPLRDSGVRGACMTLLSSACGKQQQGSSRQYSELGVEFDCDYELTGNFTLSKGEKGVWYAGGGEREMSCDAAEGRHQRGRGQWEGGEGGEGFRPEGRLGRQWLARPTDVALHSRETRGRGSVSGSRVRRRGGLKIHLPVEEHFEGVPFQRAVDDEESTSPQKTGGFAELHELLSMRHSVLQFLDSYWPHLLSPHRHECSPCPQENRTTPLSRDCGPMQGGSSVFEHMMGLCFNPETFSVRNHFPREE